MSILGLDPLLFVIGFTVIFTFVCLTAGFLSATTATKENLVTSRVERLSKVQEQLKSELNQKPQALLKEDKTSLLSRMDLTPVISRFTGEAYFGAWEKTLAQADIPLRVGEYMALRLILAVMAGSLGIILLKFPLGPLFALIPWVLERPVLNFLRKRRVNKFSNQLAEFLILIVNSLRAGQTFMQGCMVAANESPNPIAAEFKQVIKEVNLGMNEPEAMENMLERVPSEDLKIVVSAYIIQRRVGGNLAEILETTAATIRERIKIQGLINTLTTQGKLSGAIVAILPFFIGLAINAINPGYFAPLISTVMGKVLMGAAITMQLIGALVIKKIVTIEV